MIQAQQDFMNEKFPHRVITDGRRAIQIKRWCNTICKEDVIYEQYLNGRMEWKFASKSEFTQFVEFFGLEETVVE